MNFWLKFIVVLCFELISLISTQDAPSLECNVVTKLGAISGTTMTTKFGGNSFCGYRAIPFAVPPVGDLRFKAPVASGPWQDILQASEYSAVCMQTADTSAYGTFDFEQSEDCLYLNVFVPSPEACAGVKNIPVIVYIYGGACVSGFANDVLYGPQLLMNRCVILVTFNYRVGVFGFLALGDIPEYSGNAALKDQKLAMKWVKENINSFNGDPERILLFGQSAGAASVGYQLLNPESRSYFTNAFSSSSSVFSYYGRMESNDLRVEMAEKLELDHPTDGQLIDALKTIDTQTLVDKTFFDMNYNRTFVPVWGPVIENKNAIQAFITQDPMEIYASLPSDCSSMPSTIHSHMTLEYIAFDQKEILDPTLIEDLNEKFYLQLPFHDFDQAACENETQPMLNEIKQFYFGDNRIDGTTMPQYMRMLSYMNFIHPIQKEVDIRAQKSQCPQRVQINSMKTPLDVTTASVPALQNLPGTAHANDLFYVFYSELAGPLYDVIYANKDTNMDYMNAYRASQGMIDILVNYAATGNPTSASGYLNEFPAVSQDPVNDMAYVEVTKSGELVTGTNPSREEYILWKKIDERVQQLRLSGCVPTPAPGGTAPVSSTTPTPNTTSVPKGTTPAPRTTTRRPGNNNNHGPGKPNRNRRHQKRNRQYP